MNVLLAKNENGLKMEKKKLEEIPATEDLMKEHGLLNRVLLAYEEIIKKDNNDFPLEELSDSIDIIKRFIEDYHEKNEENYIFPIFEKNKKELKLVKTLRNQHKQGRKITARLQKILLTKNFQEDPKFQQEIRNLLKMFIDMYRPHEAREDTVLFPKVRSLISEKEFNKISDYFEESEHQLFGKDGFENVLRKVEKIEKKLGIYKLEQFTPKIK